MKNEDIRSAFVEGVLIAVGLSVLGYFISSAIVEIKGYERIVKVKGLAEMAVKSNRAIMPIRFEVSGNELNDVNAKIKSNTDMIIKFLNDNGFEEDEISISTPEMVDKAAQSYDGSVSAIRYTATTSVTLNSDKIDNVIKLQKTIPSLAQLGIILKNYNGETQYVFTGLNGVKPKMIEDATKNARLSAEKFAKDSDSKLGKIKEASQGYFSIEESDTGKAYMKSVRVVTDVTYYLNE